MANKINITVDQGSTFSQIFNVKYPDGSPVDLTVYNGAAQLRKHYSSTNNTPFAVALSSNGEATISLTANTTNSILPGRYLYDLEVSQGNIVMRVVEGIVTVTPNITR